MAKSPAFLKKLIENDLTSENTLLIEVTSLICTCHSTINVLPVWQRVVLCSLVTSVHRSFPWRWTVCQCTVWPVLSPSYHTLASACLTGAARTSWRERKCQSEGGRERERGDKERERERGGGRGGRERAHMQL